MAEILPSYVGRIDLVVQILNHHHYCIPSLSILLCETIIMTFNLSFFFFSYKDCTPLSFCFKFSPSYRIECQWQEFIRTMWERQKNISEKWRYKKVIIAKNFSHAKSFIRPMRHEEENEDLSNAEIDSGFQMTELSYNDMYTIYIHVVGC